MSSETECVTGYGHVLILVQRRRLRRLFRRELVLICCACDAEVIEP